MLVLRATAESDTSDTTAYLAREGSHILTLSRVGSGIWPRLPLRIGLDFATEAPHGLVP